MALAHTCVPTARPPKMGVVVSLSNDQLLLLREVYAVFDETGGWPRAQYIDKRLHQADLELDRLLASMPEGFVQPWSERQPHFLRNEDEIRVTPRGLATLEEAADDLQAFFDVTSYLASRESEFMPASPQEAEEVRVTSAEIADALDLEPDQLTKVKLLLHMEPPIWTGIQGTQGGGWSVTLLGRARHYTTIADIDDFEARTARWASDEGVPRRTQAAASGDHSPAAVAEPIDPATADGVDRRAVMVVHGRNGRARNAMFDFLRALGLRPLEWATLVTGTGSASPYVGEVLEHAFRTAAAVVVLFTPDDEARLRPTLQGASEPTHETQLTPQARPNVLFEAGMALASHPRQTVLVELGYLRPFSDIYGRHVVRLDGTGRPLRDIARRLEAAGCDVDTAGDDWASADRFSALLEDVGPGSSLGTDEMLSAIAREVSDLVEDATRWLSDRHRLLVVQLKAKTEDMATRGLLYSGGHLAALADLKRQALHEYRDEMTSKRRRYRELCAAAEALSSNFALPPLELSEASRAVLADWRSAATATGVDGEAAIDDPTSESLEPGLRAFEVSGDTCTRSP